ncbi:MAG: cytochrome c oxidase subunit II [SAR202 cluster bacterium]|nr:cytochrome c oxidase subunit II [SAR202 cluster bacterium]
MSKEMVIPAITWILLTAILELVAFLTLGALPSQASEQAKVIDDAFFLLIYLVIPVFTLVVVFLLYSIMKFRVSGRPTVDGPGLKGHLPLTLVWLAVTTVLTGFVFFHPGVTGLLELRAEENKVPDIVIQAEAVRYSWKVMYPQEMVYSKKEIVLPIHMNTQFLVSSKDVLHAFWIPAFRVKIDAVPGQTTHVNATPTKLGSYETDTQFRLQCAELCGLAHSKMFLPVTVVSEEDYREWISLQKPIK